MNNEDLRMILTVTSTKIKFHKGPKRNLTRDAILPKTCREEVIGAGVKRLLENLQSHDPIPSKISRRVLVLPMFNNSEVVSEKKRLREIRDFVSEKVQHHQQHQQQYQHLHNNQQQLKHEQYLQHPPLEQVDGVPYYPQNQDFIPDQTYEPPAELNATQVPYPPCHGPVPPPPSLSPSVKGRRTVNPVPRHRRSSHINAEHRRRSKIQKGFDALKEMIPSLSEGCSISSKDSKSEMLHKTACHVREMGGELKKQQREIDELKKEIADLNVEIESFQQRLPASGISTVDKPSCHSQALYNRYVKDRTQTDWKFWLFSFIMKPLFDSYNQVVSTSSVPSFLQSVREWGHEHLSLVNLRPCILSALRQISLQSSILTSPKKLQEEALTNVKEACDVN